MGDKRGLFIVFEGLDGAGTSTQLIKLLEHLERKNKYQDVLRTHEPWKSSEIKRRLEEEKDAYSDAEGIAKLFVEDRILHSRDLISPNLEKEVCVLCDRYLMSTCAYQLTQGVDLNKLILMHRDEEILVPDLTFFVDVSADVAQQRLHNQKKEKFEEWNFQRRLIDSYHYLINEVNKKDYLFGDIVKINGRGCVEEVAEEIRKKFEPVYDRWRDF